jgi:hypothetical protein
MQTAEACTEARRQWARRQWENNVVEDLKHSTARGRVQDNKTRRREHLKSLSSLCVHGCTLPLTPRRTSRAGHRGWPTSLCFFSVFCFGLVHGPPCCSWVTGRISGHLSLARCVHLRNTPFQCQYQHAKESKQEHLGVVANE